MDPIKGSGSSHMPNIRRSKVMNRKKISILIVLMLSVCVAFSACRSRVRYSQTGNPQINKKHTGPPPHAPAHGYRHRHSNGVELVYESNIGAYVVVGYTDHYFYRDKYYRFGGASWEVSLNIKKGWEPVSAKKLPPGLRKKHAGKKNK
jgi:hypothetical protein